jgi:hypothetical protein
MLLEYALNEYVSDPIKFSFSAEPTANGLPPLTA